MGFSFRFPVVVSSGSHPSADIELAHVLSACAGCRCGGCAARAGFLDDAVISLFPSFSSGWLVLRAQSFRILHVRHILFSSRDFSTRGGSVDGRSANAQIQSAKNPPHSTMPRPPVHGHWSWPRSKTSSAKATFCRPVSAKAGFGRAVPEPDLSCPVQPKQT